jgi:ABC-type branched-subunit amino acid transport system substrate-binding protein
MTAAQPPLVAPTFPRAPGNLAKSFFAIPRLATALLGAALLAAATLATPAHAEPGITADKIVLGRVADQTNIFAGLSKEFLDGANLYFDATNKAGGVLGRKIELRSVNDDYVPAKTVTEVKKMIDGDDVFVFFGIWGAPNNAQALTVLTEKKVPGFFPVNGAPGIRKANSPYYFTIYGSFDDETEKMVSQLVGQGIKNIAVAHLANDFGKSGLVGAEEAMARRQLKLSAVVSIEPNGSNMKAALDQAFAAQPGAIIMVGGGEPIYNFIGDYKKRGGFTQFFTLSAVGSAGLVKKLGEAAYGVAVAQTMPHPWNATIPVVRDYQKALKDAGRSDLSYMHLTGYVSAKAMVEGLRRAGKDLTRAKLITAVESMSNYDLGGYVVNFGPNQHNGSSFVDLTIIGRKGEFLR